MRKSSYINILLLLVVLVLENACSSSIRVRTNNDYNTSSSKFMQTQCDSVYGFKTLYINKIDAEVTLDDEIYNAKLTIYYKPDSLLLVSAVNAGFEIIRVAVNNDSSVFINRLDKRVYILTAKEMGYLPPVNFEDLESLFNRAKICRFITADKGKDSLRVMDRSLRNVDKRIYYSASGMAPVKFEFFQKKTGEYIVGEMTDNKIFTIYSNFIINDLKLNAEGGKTEYNRILHTNVRVNRQKYEIIYL